MELVGHLPSTVHGPLRAGLAEQPPLRQALLPQGEVAGDFHFALEWEPDEIRLAMAAPRQDPEPHPLAPTPPRAPSA